MRTRFRFTSGALATSLVSVFPIVADAHHGRDFILVETAHLPEPDTGFFLARVNHLSADSNETEIEPAMLYGVTDGFAVETHAHAAKTDQESFGVEAFAPALHFRFTPPGKSFTAGLSAEYAFGVGGEESENIADVSALFGYEHFTWIAAANLRYEKRSQSDGTWGYAVGFRHTVHEKHAIGIEALGSFEQGGYSEVMIGYYVEPSDRFTFNVGVGTKIDEGPDSTAHVTWIWRFK